MVCATRVDIGALSSRYSYLLQRFREATSEGPPQAATLWRGYEAVS